MKEERKRRHGGDRWKEMWYVIQTVTGKEEELVSLIQKKADRKWYDSCFVIQAEWMKRLGGRWRIQVRPLFPGYVFIATERPEEVFLELKGILQFARILGGEKGEFSPVEEEEREFLERLMGGGEEREEEHENGDERQRDSRRDGQGNGWGRGQRQCRIRLSLVETPVEGEIGEIYGPLKQFEGKIERISLHKRLAVVKVSLAGRERTVKVGIWLGRDIVQGMIYGKDSSF